MPNAFACCYLCSWHFLCKSFQGCPQCCHRIEVRHSVCSLSARPFGSSEHRPTLTVPVYPSAWQLRTARSTRLPVGLKSLDSSNDIERRFFDFSWLSTLTAVAWITFLSMTPSPPSVKLASACSIAGAYAIRAAAASSFSLLALAQAPFEVACYWLILPYHGVARPKATGLAALFVLRLSVWCALRPLVGWPGPQSRLIGNCLAVLTLALGSLVRAKDNMPICEHLGLAAWAPAMLLDAPWLFFLCLSFVGQALQGVSHEVTGQEGTLPQLKDARHELAHCAYFPNLVFQSIHHSFTARAYLPTVASLGDYRDRRSRLAMGLKVE